jgi:hypothetical protein
MAEGFDVNGLNGGFFCDFSRVPAAGESQEIFFIVS